MDKAECLRVINRQPTIPSDSPNIDELYKQYVDEHKGDKPNVDEFQQFCKTKEVELSKDECRKVISPKDADRSLPVNDTRNYLNKKLKIVTPQFLMAWMALREHIQKWELRYFYEVWIAL